ncbi:glycosyl transferase [Cladorrhinum sp. PSN259]|nr:glycosyl transferase [Cladorrhinum sp. PSN259]
MKVLVSTMAFAGHINPMQPICRELIRRGHQVVWLTGCEFEAKVTLTGANFRASSRESATYNTAAPPTDVDEGGSLASVVAVLRRLLLDRVPAQVHDYQEALADFPADILLVDLAAYGAHCLRDLTGIPFATLGINPLVTADAEIPPWGFGKQPPTTFLGRWVNKSLHAAAAVLLYPKLTRILNEKRTTLGLQPLPSNTAFLDAARSDILHIMPTTPSFEFPRRNLHPSVTFVGPLLPIWEDENWIAPDWWGELLARPKTSVVHITQGTVATDTTNLIKPALLALSAHPELLVIATSPDAQNELTDIPSNARVSSFVPHSRLLPHVGAMITNAGYNGVLAALSYGVPLVCAGRTEDKADVSSRVAWCGAGIDLATNTPAVEALENAALRILKERSFRDAAERVAKDFASHNGPREAAEQLERVAKGH